MLFFDALGKHLRVLGSFFTRRLGVADLERFEVALALQRHGRNEALYLGCLGVGLAVLLDGAADDVLAHVI